MDFNQTDSLKSAGFSGFKSVEDLWSDRSCIPKIKGVYLVINSTHENTEYINPGVGGFFKGKDPNLSVNELKEHRVQGSQVVYIGKAGSLTGKATLYSRLGQYLRFGQGKNVGHYGGRLIWQIKNPERLIFCWKPTPDEEPRLVEKKLLETYTHQFNTLPFANLSR